MLFGPSQRDAKSKPSAVGQKESNPLSTVLVVEAEDPTLCGPGEMRKSKLSKVRPVESFRLRLRLGGLSSSVWQEMLLSSSSFVKYLPSCSPKAPVGEGTTANDDDWSGYGRVWGKLIVFFSRSFRLVVSSNNT